MNIKNWWKRITKQTEDITFDYKIPFSDAIQQIEKEYLSIGIRIVYTPNKNFIMSNSGMYFTHDYVSKTKLLLKYQH